MSIELGLLGRPVPDLQVALCDRCHHRSWGRTLRLVALAVLVLVLGAGAARLTFLLWPWVPWPLFACCTTAGTVVAWVLGAMALKGLSHGSSGWRGVPVRVVKMDGRGWTIAVASAPLASALAASCDADAAEGDVWESDVALPAVAAVVAVVLSVSVLWLAWHPVVRVVNVTSSALEVSVDGRPMALLASLPGESPGAGTDVRVPQGRRVFRATRLDGELVDESVGRVGRGEAQLYAPGVLDRCFRVEQRAYGRARQPEPAVLVLARDRSFHTLSVPIDGWFQPNPASKPDVWFSGGVRRAVRVGECPAGGGTVPDTPGSSRH